MCSTQNNCWSFFSDRKCNMIRSNFQWPVFHTLNLATSFVVLQFKLYFNPHHLHIYLEALLDRCFKWNNALTGSVLQFSESLFEKCYNLIKSFQFSRKIMWNFRAFYHVYNNDDGQNVGNLKWMWDIFTVTELRKYLTRYVHLNQQHS